MTTEEMIRSDGYIDNTSLWRRWILIQIYRNTQSAQTIEQKLAAFQDSFFRTRPPSYEWSTASQEIQTLSELTGPALVQKERFFSFDVILHMLHDHAAHLTANHMQVPKELRNSITLTDIAKSRQSYTMLQKAIQPFTKKCLAVLDRKYRSPTWQQAFQCAGAYHAMDNLIKFYDCRMPKKDGGLCDSVSESLSMLEDITDEHTENMSQESADRLFCIMLHLMETNHFNPDRKEVART